MNHSHASAELDNGSVLKQCNLVELLSGVPADDSIADVTGGITAKLKSALHIVRNQFDRQPPSGVIYLVSIIGSAALATWLQAMAALDPKNTSAAFRSVIGTHIVIDEISK
jgi:hypothetical protein